MRENGREVEKGEGKREAEYIERREGRKGRSME